MVARGHLDRLADAPFMKYEREIPRWRLAVAEVELLTRSE